MAAGDSDDKTLPSSQNYYDLLGISKTATEEEIKRAYRKTALRLHPDKNPDPNAASQFQSVDKAYKILSDPKLRSTYDQFGANAADMMRRMNDDYADILQRMPAWKKILITEEAVRTTEPNVNATNESDPVLKQPENTIITLGNSEPFKTTYEATSNTQQ
ncbi:unnamed protein product [Didymodactylos carnosus]|uniref:DnaJ homolog subfamily B member 9 n=1 Tax=Didymodactylos carnosus TaxID=1234261 RepID=A0A813X4H7_9BILA|nr:unnamed protein product [Didymodactylos carnosus]CAF1280391.1 unnamed protein product [Didymodactylos carnosus]CAF3652604.1 unnamed protein product [Didymodactylos carnosus]CAF4085246.1 unnamed protein product [Didymodactylos carnosus]